MKPRHVKSSLIIQKIGYTDWTVRKREANNFGEIDSHVNDVKSKIAGLAPLNTREAESHEIRRLRQLHSGHVSDRRPYVFQKVGSCPLSSN